MRVDLAAGFLAGIEHRDFGAPYVVRTTQFWLASSDFVLLYKTSRLLAVMVILVIPLLMFITHGSAEH